MKEYMFYIRNAGDAKKALGPATHLEFVKECEVYISKLKRDGKLIAAQPLLREGIHISRTKTQWKITEVDPANEVQVGYYHIRANDLEDAVSIAKQNPEFAYVPSATIEVRPVKMKEEQTSFVYPKG